ncbi:MAG: hypothetical protein EXS02_14150 [Planctomycetes bacterium]|nr:hypothetical protein [Planctomycetota bacterium]
MLRCMPRFIYLPLLLYTLLPAQAPDATAKQGAESSTVSLQHNLQSGSKFSWALTVTADVEQAVQDQKIRSQTRFVLHFDVAMSAAFNSKTTTALHFVRRVEASSASNLTNVDYDSARKDSDPGPLAPLAQLVGKTFNVTLDALGQVQKVLPPNDLAQNPQEQLGIGDFDTLFTPYFLPLPATPIPVAASWDAQLKFLDPQLGDDGNVKVTSTLLRVVDQRAHLKRQLQVQPPQRTGLQIQVQKAGGSAVFDLATGRVQESLLELQSTSTQSIGSNRTAKATSRLLLQAALETTPTGQKSAERK